MKTKAKRWVELADRLEDIENELEALQREVHRIMEAR